MYSLGPGIISISGIRNAVVMRLSGSYFYYSLSSKESKCNSFQQSKMHRHERYQIDVKLTKALCDPYAEHIELE